MRRGKYVSEDIKELIDKNSAESYKVLRNIYLDIISGKLREQKVDKEGRTYMIPPTIATRLEAALALQRIDIDKVAGNAKAKETDSQRAASSSILSQLKEMAEKKGKKIDLKDTEE